MSADPSTVALRAAAAMALGVTRKTLRGPQWERELRGVYRPSTEVDDGPMRRISHATAVLTGDSAIGGWAALRVQGITWFDGLDRTGAERRVLVHCLPGSRLRRRRTVEPFRGRVDVDETIDLESYRVATLARAAFDEMRLTSDPREAVVAADMAVSTVSGLPHTTLDRVARVLQRHPKVRGVVAARAALALASSRSASPWETRTRLVAELDAGLRGLAVNVPVFSSSGSLLGVADLFDEECGLVIESDGAHHRENRQHTDDNHREERFENEGAVVCRVTSLDHGDRMGLAARMVAARRSAGRRLSHGLTTRRPDWWWGWPPGRRWD